ncbi:MAG: ketopantoate reductase family protein [Candidatus Lokiarchaeota archaeon]|nr:ketopantoate reductase family protein [Candidatus Lokiarchaeota archaeon]
MEKNNNDLRVVIYGIGGIGATLGGWLTQKNNNVYLLARGENAKALKSNGSILKNIVSDSSETIVVKVIEDLNEIANIDVVVITVKNYDVEKVAKDISEKLGDNPIVVGLQNGFENQRILPKYFTKIVYAVVVQSGWVDKPGIFGTRGKGHLTLGTPENKNPEIAEKVAKILTPGIPTITTQEFQDAAHSKLIINLSNATFTLISSELKDDDSIFKLWNIFMNVYLEGVKVVKAAGYKEYKLKGLPSWDVMEMGKNLEKATAINNFKRNLKYSWFNSMAQDMIHRKKNQSELESLTGYLIQLADSFNIEIPYNRVIYELSEQQFKKKPYQPLPVETIWEEINKNLNNG